MGNSVAYDGGFRLLRKGDRSYHIRLGYVGIESKERKVEYIRGTGERRETWEVSYKTHDELTCRFTLIMTSGGGYEALEIKVEDETNENLYRFTDAARTSESCLLYAESKTVSSPNPFPYPSPFPINDSSYAHIKTISSLDPHSRPFVTNDRSFSINRNTVKFEEYRTNNRDAFVDFNGNFGGRVIPDFNRNTRGGLVDRRGVSETRVYRCFYNLKVPSKTRITNARGDVSETSVFMYGHATRRGLMVREWITKRGDKVPFMGTVAHYYANTRGWGGEDVGLSLMVKIRVTEQKKQHIEVDGPVEHPASALFYMFDHVSLSLVWSPTACPHCANTIQSKHYDNNDRDRGNEGHSLHNSDGKFKGNATCSYFEGSTITFNYK